MIAITTNNSIVVKYIYFSRLVFVALICFYVDILSNCSDEFFLKNCMSYGMMIAIVNCLKARTNGRASPLCHRGKMDGHQRSISDE